MITMRPYQSEDDYQRMQNLIRENYRQPEGQLYPSAMDLDYWRFIYDESPEGVKSAQLWQDENGRVVGFVWMNEDATDWVCHADNRGLLDEMLEWSEMERIKLYGSQDEEPLYNCISIFDCDPHSQKTAAGRGYQQTEDFGYYGRRSLTENIPQVSVPKGYTIKSITTEDEIKQRAAMNILAGNEITFEKYKIMMEKSPTYRQDLDLTGLAPHGNVAGFCTVWYDAVSHIGIFEPYAVHPDHLRKGLGRSLLLEGMKRLKDLGAVSVFVDHGGLDSEESDPALELNAAVGFQQAGRHYVWTKKL